MSKIEWCDESWSPVVGCTKCSPGCKNCYAEKMACRLNNIFAAQGNDDLWEMYTSVLRFDYSKSEFGNAVGWNGNVRFRHDLLDKPLHWRKPRKIFVCSMSDLFHEKVPFEFIDKVIKVLQKAKWHTYQILTKRPRRMFEYIKWHDQETKRYVLQNRFMLQHPYPHLHFGVSVSTQAEADEKIPVLLQIPAAVRFVSIEPMLEGIDITPYLSDGYNICRSCGWYGRDEELPEHEGLDALPCPKCDSDTYAVPLDELLDWVIVSCESSPKRRPCKIEWIDSVVDQCKAAGVPVFVKQINVNGKVVKMPPEYPQEYPEQGC